ncbi:MAG: hypothetical protein IJR89_03550 [Clostridia bacterium]|nr:hypothetical protein [Clostridia bacterium]
MKQKLLPLFSVLAVLLACLFLASCQSEPLQPNLPTTQPTEAATTKIEDPNKGPYDYLPSTKQAYNYLKEIYSNLTYQGASCNFDTWSATTTSDGVVKKSGDATLVITNDSLILRIGEDLVWLNYSAVNSIITSSDKDRAFRIFDALFQNCPDEYAIRGSALKDYFNKNAKLEINGTTWSTTYEKAGETYTVSQNNKTGPITIIFGRTKDQLFS